MGGQKGLLPAHTMYKPALPCLLPLGWRAAASLEVYAHVVLTSNGGSDTTTGRAHLAAADFQPCDLALLKLPGPPSCL